MRDLPRELESIVADPDFANASSAVAREWRAQGVGIEAVDPVLRFIEAHPDLDYGTPGALVHFVETFCRKGYEKLLLASLRRQPTLLTVWMVNRILNGTKEPQERQSLAAAMRAVVTHPAAREETRRLAREFLDEL